MIIGLISDKSRVGKDTVADILVEYYGFKKRNLADPIRKVLLKVLDTIPEGEKIRSAVNCLGWDFVKDAHPWTVDAMIALGQGMRDEVNHGIWIDGVLNGYGTEFDDLVIPDVRQRNEAELILDEGGFIWKIDSEVRGIKRGMDGLLRDVGYVYEIHNNGTIEELHSKIQWIMEEGGWADVYGA